MDPFSESSEVFAIQQAYYSGEYARTIDLDISGFAESAKLKARELQLRAKIHLKKAAEVVTELQGNDDDAYPGLAVIREYAEYVNAASEARKSGIVDKLTELTKKYANNETVQYFGAIVYASEQRYSDAISLLSGNQGDLDGISLLVQIYLLQNRLDLAQQQIADAKKIAQDSIVFNLAEAWVNLRENGDKAQGAFYIYEELSSASGTGPSVRSYVGQAVAQLLLGRIPEAEESLNEALKIDPTNADALANSITTAIVSGKEYTDIENRLEQAQKDHISLVDLQAKNELFSKIVGKYTQADSWKCM